MLNENSDTVYGHGLNFLFCVTAVHGILSVLKKPVTRECNVSVKRQFPEEGNALHTSDIVYIETQNREQGQLVDDSRGQCSVVEDSNGDIFEKVSSHEREDPKSKILTPAFSLWYVNTSAFFLWYVIVITFNC